MEIEGKERREEAEMENKEEEGQYELEGEDVDR